MPVRLFRDMIAAVCEKKQGRDGLSSFQTLVISRNSRTGKRRVWQVNQMPAVNSSTTMKEMPMPPPSGMVNRSPHSRR